MAIEARPWEELERFEFVADIEGVPKVRGQRNSRGGCELNL